MRRRTVQLLDLATHLLEECSHFWVTQNGRLRKIPGDMSLGEDYLLCLKMQRDPPDLLAISLQPLFSKLSTICRKTFSNRVAGCSIDLVQGRWLIAEPLADFFERRWRVFCPAHLLFEQVKNALLVDGCSFS
jgi:hypothetical protein